MRLRVSLTFLAGTLLAGLTCDDGAPRLQLADLVARAFCAHQLRCCSPYELSAVTSDRYRTEEDCVAFATLSANQQLGSIQGAMDLGRITVDPARAQACVEAWRDRACNLSLQLPETIGPLPNVADVLAFCPDLLVGHVPPDRACTVSQECAPGSRCVTGGPSSGGAAGTFGGMLQPETTQSALGACVPYQQAGARCNVSRDCDPAAHLSCHRPEFVCRPAAQLGEACMTEFDGLTGVLSSNCDESRHLYCDNIFTFQCRRYPQAGEPCDPLRVPTCDPDPALALSCDSSFSGNCRLPNNEGEACGAPAIAPCREDLACHPTQSDGIGVCGSLPVLGEACTDRCASPAVCDNGSCAMPGTAPAGAPCTANGDCISLACLGYPPSMFCAAPMLMPRCVGAGITPGAISGFGGQGGFGGTGMVGTGGFFPGGFGGPFDGGLGAAGGMSGGFDAGPGRGCQLSFIAPGDPLIANFDDGTSVLPIGGTYTYAAPTDGLGGPILSIENGAMHVTAATTGQVNARFWGAGIYFLGDLSGLACVDATAHKGVQFDISGTVGGSGCSIQYATNDSAHTNSAADPKGTGDATSWAPQASLMVTSSVTTVRMPFSGADGPSGGNPAIPIDRSRLTGVQWQLTTAAGTENSCLVDITIDNVHFF